MSDVGSQLGVGPPPGAAGAVAVPPIGVPPGYLAQKPGIPSRGDYESGVRTGGPGTVPISVVPHYYAGMEWTPASLSAEDIARLQRQMLDAGLYEPAEAKSARLGIWDDASLAAYTRLLTFANATGTDSKTALTDYKTRRDQFGKPKGLLQTNPADIEAIAQQAALAKTGRKLDDQQLARFTTAYHQTIDNPDPTTYAPPDPTTFANQQIEQIDPQGVVHGTALQAEKEWNDLISSTSNG